MGVVSQRLRDSARGQDCTLRLTGICNHDPETTVLAHLPSPVSGMGTKSDDWHGVFACSACHAALDQHDYDPRDIDRNMLVALQRTQKIWFETGLLTIGGKPPAPTKKTLPHRKLYDGC
jgi:hypothetical protein